MYQVISNSMGSLSRENLYTDAVKTALAWSQLRGEELYVFYNSRCIFTTTEGQIMEMEEEWIN